MRVAYENLEEYARQKIQEFMQEIRFRETQCYEVLKDEYAGKEVVDGVMKGEISNPERMAA